MLNGFFIFCLLVLAFYCAHIGRFVLGLLQLKAQNKTLDIEKAGNLGISVVVIFRNEAMNLSNLVHSFEKINYPHEKVEFIFVNDESDDDSYVIMKDLLHAASIKSDLIQSQGGKKAGLVAALKKANNELIVCTDADCIVPSNWLLSMSKHFEDQRVKLVLGPVAFISSNRLIQKFFGLEFLSLIASTAGSTFFHRSIMANGGNLAYRKSILQEFDSNVTKSELSSGDDIFLLSAVKKRFGPSSISFSYSISSEVVTKSPETIKAFIHQRVRWISKSKSYSDADMIFSTVLIGLTNFLLLALSVVALLNYKVEYTFLFWGLKSLVDFVLLAIYTNDFNRMKLLWLFIPLVFFYPIYVCSIGFLGVFLNPKWKGRSLNI